MEPTTNHQTHFTPTGQLTPYGRDAIATTRATARRLLAIRESTAMELTTPTYQACKQLAADLAVAFRPIGLAARRAAAAMAPLAAALEEAQRGPTIGRKRRRRRARGRARGR